MLPRTVSDTQTIRKHYPLIHAGGNNLLAGSSSLSVFGTLHFVQTGIVVENMLFIYNSIL